MAATLFFLEDVHFSFELGVWRQRTWRNNHLAALDLFALDTAEQQTSIVTGLTLVKALLEGLNTGHD